MDTLIFINFENYDQDDGIVYYRFIFFCVGAFFFWPRIIFFPLGSLVFWTWDHFFFWVRIKNDPWSWFKNDPDSTLFLNLDQKKVVIQIKKKDFFFWSGSKNQDFFFDPDQKNALFFVFFWAKNYPDHFLPKSLKSQLSFVSINTWSLISQPWCIVTEFVQNF